MTPKNPDFVLNRPAALIAAVPAVLGFAPQKSLVLVGVDRGQMGAVMRVDLTDCLGGDLDHLVDVASASHADAVIAVIVDAEGAACRLCNDSYRELSEDLGELLADNGVVLLDTHVVDRIAAGGRWHCVDGCGAGGRIDDPSSSPLSVAAVLDGRRLYGSRAELQEVIAVDLERDPAAIARTVAELAAAEQAAPAEDPDVARGRTVRRIIAAMDRLAAGANLTDADLAALAYALTDLIVRDIVYGLAVGEAAARAEALWVLLARGLPGPWRAEVLTLLAYSAYVRGDGPLAGVALEQALRVDPTHRMAGLLDDALQSGLRPERIRQLASTGYRLARQLGVELPPRRPPRAAG